MSREYREESERQEAKKRALRLEAKKDKDLSIVGSDSAAGDGRAEPHGAAGADPLARRAGASSRPRQEVFFPHLSEFSRVRVMDIQFAYKNHELIKLLKERGAHILAYEYGKAEEVTKKI